MKKLTIKLFLTVFVLILGIAAPLVVFVTELHRSYQNFHFFKELWNAYLDLMRVLKKAWIEPTICQVCGNAIGADKEHKDRCVKCRRFNVQEY